MREPDVLIVREKRGDSGRMPSITIHLLVDQFEESTARVGQLAMSEVRVLLELLVQLRRDARSLLVKRRRMEATSSVRCELLFDPVEHLDVASQERRVTEVWEYGAAIWAVAGEATIAGSGLDTLGYAEKLLPRKEELQRGSIEVLCFDSSAELTFMPSRRARVVHGVETAVARSTVPVEFEQELEEPPVACA